MSGGGNGLFDRPVLALDPGFHTAPIRRADVDAAGRIAVTGSDDRTVRIWSLADGTLKRTIRLPQGPGNIGKVYAVAASPDGELVAAGGWTRGIVDEEQIYIFSAVSGMLRQRIAGLSDVVNLLAFSPDGDQLAATLGDGGARLYARDGPQKWVEVMVDTDCRDQSHGIAFAPNGRFATTCLDGHLRLHDVHGGFSWTVPTPHARPTDLAFNPVDGRLAVGFDDATKPSIYDGRTLERLPAPDSVDIDNGDLSIVAWSTDGGTLFAAGSYDDGSGNPVVAWENGGAGPRRNLPAGANTVVSLRSLRDGAILVAAGDPWLGVIEADGAPRWTRTPKQIDPRGQRSNLAVSFDGVLVEFGLRILGNEDRLRFDVAALTVLSPEEDGRVVPPAQDGLVVAGWEDTRKPTLDGKPLPLDRYEMARSLAIHPDGDRFVLGAEWYLRAFDKTGAALWRHAAPDVVWAVNISGDGRLAVAAYGDGTIRWHRMEDGAELLALFLLPDGGNWVAWTPEGIYAATPGARGILRWHVNRGWDRTAEAIPVSEIPETNRPEVIKHVLPQMGTPGALHVTEMAKIRGAVRRATGSDISPGARLHALAIGISDYGEAARHLDLAYADRDARDIAAALRHSQSGLYAEVRASCLVNGEATKTRIFAGLEEIRHGMEAGGGGDLAVIHFSGHGDTVDGKFYLLPHGIDDASDAAVKANGLPAVQFHDEIAAIAGHGRVILLVDACRSGGATSLPDRSLRAMLTAANVTVFTSCAAKQLSQEGMAWENGAFTEALLEALGRADYDHDGLIGVSDLSRYLGERVPALTAGAQRPEVETRSSDLRILARL